jgi:hypothetical protein
MNAKTYALKYGHIEKVGEKDKFIHEGTLTTRAGLKINEATLEPDLSGLSGAEDLNAALEGKAFILFDVDEQKEVKSGTL